MRGIGAVELVIAVVPKQIKVKKIKTNVRSAWMKPWLKRRAKLRHGYAGYDV